MSIQTWKVTIYIWSSITFKDVHFSCWYNILYHVQFWEIIFVCSRLFFWCLLNLYKNVYDIYVSIYKHYLQSLLVNSKMKLVIEKYTVCILYLLSWLTRLLFINVYSMISSINYDNNSRYMMRVCSKSNSIIMILKIKKKTSNIYLFAHKIFAEENINSYNFVTK